jgi:hypothetical protein
MSATLFQLPRPRDQRSSPPPLGFFVRVSRNDHREMLDLLASGERGMFGFVVDAQHVERHRELLTEARGRNMDLVLDPKTHAMAFSGGNTDKLAALPWGQQRHHQLSDFDGGAALEKAELIVQYAVANGFTQLLGPTHVLRGANDPWLRRDIAMMAERPKLSRGQAAMSA